jgi:hypothetical protein
MTIDNFDSELADFAEAVATTGLALAGMDGRRLLVVAFPEDAFRKVREAIVRASGHYETQSTASTLWALLEPFLDDYERAEPDPEIFWAANPDDIVLEDGTIIAAGTWVRGFDKDGNPVGEIPGLGVVKKPDEEPE